MIRRAILLLQHILANRLDLNITPAFVNFIVTWRCNFRCSMCDIWKKDVTGDEMDIEKIKKVFSQFGSLLGLRLTGGEPFLRDDLADIINFIIDKNSPHIVHITSNGYLTERIIGTLDKIKEPSRIHIKISIDAFGEGHDRIRGIPGAFEKAGHTVKELKKLRERKGIFCGINQTIVSREAYEKRNRLLEWCKKMDLPLERAFAYKNVAVYSNGKRAVVTPYEKLNQLYGDLDKDEMLEFIEKEISSVKEIDNPIERILRRYYFKAAKSFIKGRGLLPPCSHLRSHFHIFPNGDIPVCYFNSNIVGNLVETPLREIWKKDTFKKARRWIKSCPGCLAGCELLPNGIFSGDIVRAL